MREGGEGEGRKKGRKGGWEGGAGPSGQALDWTGLGVQRPRFQVWPHLELPVIPPWPWFLISLPTGVKSNNTRKRFVSYGILCKSKGLLLIFNQIVFFFMLFFPDFR